MKLCPVCNKHKTRNVDKCFACRHSDGDYIHKYRSTEKYKIASREYWKNKCRTPEYLAKHPRSKYRVLPEDLQMQIHSLCLSVLNQKLFRLNPEKANEPLLAMLTVFEEGGKLNETALALLSKQQLEILQECGLEENYNIMHERIYKIVRNNL